VFLLFLVRGCPGSSWSGCVLLVRLRGVHRLSDRIRAHDASFLSFADFSRHLVLRPDWRLAIAVLSVVTTMVSDVAAGIPVMGFGMAGWFWRRTPCLHLYCRTYEHSYGNLINASANARQRCSAPVAERERLDKEIAEVARRERLPAGPGLAR